jgi:hypothetical protein
VLIETGINQHSIVNQQSEINNQNFSGPLAGPLARPCGDGRLARPSEAEGERHRHRRQPRATPSPLQFAANIGLASA